MAGRRKIAGTVTQVKKAGSVFPGWVSVFV